MEAALEMYNLSLIALSVLIAWFAAYAVIDLSERVAAARGTARQMWMLAGAAAMGFGVWTMQLIGLLAWVNTTDSYEFSMIGLSMLVSVVTAYGVLMTIKRRRVVTKGGILLGAMLMGVGIMVSNMLGLHGVQAGYSIEYSAIGIGVVLLYVLPVSYLVLSFTFYAPKRKRMGRRPHKVISAVLLGLATTSFHYVSMRSVAAIEELPNLEANAQGDLVLLSFSLGIAAMLIQLLVLLGALYDRRMALHSANMTEQRFRSLFAHNPFFVASFDLDGNVTDVNGAAELLLGYERAELMGRSYQAILNGEMMGAFKRSLQGATPSCDVAIPHRSGRLLNLRVTNVPVIVDGRIVGAYVIAQDITEHKRAEELLHRSDKLSAIGQLAAGIAHEIRNPLTAIKGFTQLLKEKAQRDVEYYDVILSELDRVNLIVDEFLFLSKPQSSKFRPVRLEQLLQLIVTLLEPQAILHDVRIQTRFQPLPEAAIEENQIKQVFINLLKNAIEAMPAGGDLIIELWPDEDDNARVRLIDQGCGITEEQLQKIGDPFFTTKEKGTGLGLMVSFKIIEDHGGRLEIESEIGVGTTIDVLLPLTQQTALKPQVV
ncbi:hypothetical protein CIG75_06770 [Tumebacillus algifaecis]|uniref:histidine kinase n=1 Tax=Tumebacillus algifaecis TaxID=1214604 RepID=A0A223D008_9BACL|nr:ATP-binding protein [Tumebacillus algifaecis]ASS74704.1 hypothetical protein CIG75_06770 [Tumebacillus algifaecis]